MQAAEQDVAVVGAGIVGASAAYWLARQGARVVVVEGALRAQRVGARPQVGGAVSGGDDPPCH